MIRYSKEENIITVVRVIFMHNMENNFSQKQLSDPV